MQIVDGRCAGPMSGRVQLSASQPRWVGAVCRWRPRSAWGGKIHLPVIIFYCYFLFQKALDGVVKAHYILSSALCRLHASLFYCMFEITYQFSKFTFHSSNYGSDIIIIPYKVIHNIFFLLRFCVTITSAS